MNKPGTPEPKQQQPQQNPKWIVGIILGIFICLAVYFMFLKKHRAHDNADVTDADIPTAHEDIRPDLQESAAPTPSLTPKNAPASKALLDETSEQNIKKCLNLSGQDLIKKLVANWRKPQSLSELQSFLKEQLAPFSEEGLNYKTVEVRESGRTLRMQLEQNEDSDKEYFIRLFELDEDELPIPVPMPEEYLSMSPQEAVEKFSRSGEMVGDETNSFWKTHEGLVISSVTRDQNVNSLNFSFDGHLLGCAPRNADPNAPVDCACMADNGDED